MSDELLKSLWMQRLPTNTQTVLSTSEDALDKLATMADRIHDIVSTNICNMETTPATTSTTSWESQLCEIIKWLIVLNQKNVAQHRVVNAADPPANHVRDQLQQNQTIVSIINVSVMTLRNVPHPAAGKGK